MRPDAVVGVLPQTDHDPRLVERGEDLLLQALVLQLCSEMSASLQASAKLFPCAVSTSIGRNSRTTCSALGLCPRFSLGSSSPS